MKLDRLTLLRPNMGDYRSSDGLPPLAMGILAARTPKDVEITLYDDKVEIIPTDDRPDLVAITVETFTARRAYDLAAGYRAKGVPVVMGGYHPTFLPDEALEHADAVVIGDAEGSWERLLADFGRGTLQRTYSGGNDRSLADFAIDRSIFNGKKYMPVVPIQYGRGCRFVCDFCSISAFYKGNVRTRTAQSIAEELQQMNASKLIFFVDDNLFNSRIELDALLSAIRPLKLRWSCQISIDVAKDDSLLDRMAEAGCMLVLIGFESLSSDSLRQMGKPWNRVAGDYLAVVKKFHQRGMAVYGTFVFGYDGDTAATIQDCFDFALQAKLEIANFNPLAPTPGSPLFERLKLENRLLSPQWWLDPNYRYGDPIFVPKSMSPDEFAQKCFDAKKAFYAYSSIAHRLFRADAVFDWYRTAMVGLANVISRREIMRKQNRTLGD